jgi:S-formylglutathione hydrolase FrmB
MHMRAQALLGFVLVSLFAFPCAAQSSKQTAGKIVETTIPAPSLKGNLLGDATEQKISVYLPPSYDSSQTKRYPVVYLLHGLGIGRMLWMRDEGFNILPVLNGLISSGKAREMIVVAPNGRNAFNGSFFVNSATTGNWEDHISRDVVSYVDANYRTVARASSRGIAGFNMGGFGAISIGMKHPEIFSSISAFSPCCLALEGEFLEPLPGWSEVAKLTSKEDILKLPTSPPSMTPGLPAISAAFAPNAANKPIYGDLLYREHSGKLVRDEGVAARWKAKMPLYLVDQYKANLVSMRGIFLDHWQSEKLANVRIGTALFARALAERGIPHVFEIYAGDRHITKVRERMETRVFLFFSETLDFSER